MRISDWSSDVCSSDLFDRGRAAFANRRERCQTHRRDDRAGRRFDRGDRVARVGRTIEAGRTMHMHDVAELLYVELGSDARRNVLAERRAGEQHVAGVLGEFGNLRRSEEHTSELQSLMRISYAVFCLKKNKTT